MKHETELANQLRSLAIPREQVTEHENKRKWPFYLAGLVLVVGAGWVLLQPDTLPMLKAKYAAIMSPAPQAQRVPVDNTPPILEAVSPAALAIAPPAPAIIGSGYVVAQRLVSLKSQIGGRVIELRVRAGQTFKSGQVLARLDDSSARADLGIAEAQLRTFDSEISKLESKIQQAETILRRTENLVQRGVQTQTILDTDGYSLINLRHDLATAKAQRAVQLLIVQKSRIALESYTLTAPFDGVMVSRKTQVGEILPSGLAGGGRGQEVAVLLDPDALVIEVDIAETNISRVYVNQSASAQLDAYPNQSFSLRVQTIVPQASAQKGTVPVRLVFTGTTAGVLPNMSAKVTFDPLEISN